MKRNISKKNFDKFKKRNTHKRLGKNKRVKELKDVLSDSGIDPSGVALRDSYDLGQRGRVGKARKRDEVCVRGVFSGSKSGFGFVSVDGYDRDIFIPETKTLGAIDGDLVDAVFHSYYSGTGEEKTEGRVTKIVAYGRETVVGTLIEEPSYMHRGRRVPGYLYLVPDDPKLSLRPVVTDSAGAVDGDKVSVRLKRGTGMGYYPCAEVVSLLGRADSKEANYEAILIESGIPLEFSDEELEYARKAASAPLVDDGRVRFDRAVIFTIDGEGAKDLDDAVSLRRISGGWQLSVHIADVSSYVAEKSPLDRCVMKRGTSVYFTDKVVPMLPECLSNGACSLNPGEDKYALSAIINLDDEGNIKGVKLVPSIIRSRLRGVYSEVNRLFDGTADSALRTKYKAVLPTLEKMRELYQILIKKARARGYLELDIAEAEIVLDTNGSPVDIVKRERGDAERIIEHFMLTANEAVATLLCEREIPCVYRVHEPPPEDKLREFVEFAHNLGFNTEVISLGDVSPKAFSRLLDEAEKKGLLPVVSYTMLRSMSKAEYSSERSAHFGLGIEKYCHFTSPIRRLSDLATHRIIHKVLLEGRSPVSYRSYAKRAAAAATETEMRAVAVERRIEDLYKVIYMMDKVGEEFIGTVSSVTSFGMFVELSNTCEGLVPMSDMPGLFVFDEKNRSLRHRELIFRLADTVKVRLEEADIVRGKLRFSLVL